MRRFTGYYLGGLTAITLYRYRFRGKQAVSGMLFIVMMSPDIVMAVSLLALFMVVGISLEASGLYYLRA